jgi:hypothetical protein
MKDIFIIKSFKLKKHMTLTREVRFFIKINNEKY